jgi:hypothetical protein
VTATRWRSGPDEALQLWRDIFGLSEEGLDLTALCPVCGNAQLHRWYWLDPKRVVESADGLWTGSGIQWQWCSCCRSYSHGRSLVPVWWNSPMSVSFDDLMHDPDPIERARLEMINSSQAESD